MRAGGIFGGNKKPLAGLGAATSNCGTGAPFPTAGGTVAVVAWMTANCVACGGTAANCAKQSGTFTANAIKCDPQCAGFRQDTPEWSQCIQKCHGLTPVDYGPEKAACEKQGKVYSWLENGCVSKDVLDSCPAGTMYATYPDGLKKCIAEQHIDSKDVTSSKCPAGTTLQTVSGGKTCVSPVKPKDPATKTPVKTTPGTTTGIQPGAQPPSQGLLSNPLVWAGLAAAGIGIVILATGKKGGAKGKSKSSSRKSSARSSRGRAR